MSHSFSTPIFIRPDGQSSILEKAGMTAAEAGFDEAWLQRLIHEHPHCLPISEIEAAFEGVVSICRELPTKHGPIDNLLMTPNGDIVLVEVKLWRNPESRRKVVAQALDYASCIFEMDYAELEGAVLRAQFTDGQKPKRLYDLLPENEVKDEASFVDAVNTNLRKGRALILVAGDGIRTETERLASLLQSHAGSHFTFALVELSAYRMADNSGLLVCPRILAQTVMIERGIVRIDNGRATVVAPELQPTPSGQIAKSPESITAEQFYEAMANIDKTLPDKLRNFIAKLEPLGIYPDFKQSLNLKWDAPTGNPVNLGYIKRNGEVWTDLSNWKAPLDLSNRYNEELGSALGLDVEKERFKSWQIRDGAHAPRIGRLADKLDLWIPAAQNFIEAIQARAKEEN